jgi:hypothetical protein
VTTLRPSCECTSVALLRGGALSCAACGAAIVLAPATDTGVFSTEAGSWPPRARSRRHARELIRRVDGHERMGAGRETQWRVSAEAYHAHHRKQRVTVVTAPLPELPNVESWVRTAGYRITRRTAT